MLKIKNSFISYFCFNKKFLIFNLVSRNLKVKYRRSYLGFFWTVLTPISLAVMYYFVFQVVLQLKMPNYLIFILIGILPWSFLSLTVLEGMEGIVGNVGLLSKVPVPIQVFAFSGAITNLINLFLSIPILFMASLWSGAALGWTGLFVIYYCAILFLISYGLAVVWGILYAYFRDFKHIVTIGMQLWFYGTPVIYSEVQIPSKYLWILDLNPVGRVFVGLHQCIVEGVLPSPENLYIPLSWAVAVTATSMVVLEKSRRQLVEIL